MGKTNEASKETWAMLVQYTEMVSVDCTLMPFSMMTSCCALL